MKKLTIKWKLFLIINYFLLVFNIFSLIGFVVSVLNGTDAPIILYYLGIVFVLICISTILNIYIVNRFFPDNLLTSGTTRFLRFIRIVMLIVTALSFFACAVGLSVIFDRSMGARPGDILGMTYFALSALLCLYVTILQFQIPRYLNQQSAGNINQLIDSIGK